MLLADFLRANGFREVGYVLGGRRIYEDRYSHAWLVVDGDIVDITADQFPELTEQVIVSRSSAFHELFELDHEHTSNYRDYNMVHSYPSLPSTYRAIMKAIGYSA